MKFIGDTNEFYLTPWWYSLTYMIYIHIILAWIQLTNPYLAYLRWHLIFDKCCNVIKELYHYFPFCKPPLLFPPRNFSQFISIRIGCDYQQPLWGTFHVFSETWGIQWCGIQPSGIQSNGIQPSGIQPSDIQPSDILSWYRVMLYSTTYSQNSSQANQAKSRQLTSLHWMIKGDKIRTLLHAYTTFMLMAYYAVRSSSLLLALMSNLPFLHCSLFPTKLFQTYQQYRFRSIIPIANSCLHDKLDVKWLIMSGSNHSYKEKYNSVIWLWFELPKYAKHNSTETAF